MPLEGLELPLVLGMLMADMAARTQAGAPQRLRADRSAVELVDTGRVLWLPSQSAWQVVSREVSGVTRRIQKGLRVPVTDIAGVAMTAEQRDRARGALLVSARQRWNQLDKSTAERYFATLCELPDEA